MTESAAKQHLRQGPGPQGAVGTGQPDMFLVVAHDRAGLPLVAEDLIRTADASEGDGSQGMCPADRNRPRRHLPFKHPCMDRLADISESCLNQKWLKRLRVVPDQVRATNRHG